MCNEKGGKAKITIAKFGLGSIVQVPLHNVDTTKAGGNNLTLVILEVVQKRDNSCPMYHLACKDGVLVALYHPSYLKAIPSTSAVLRLVNVIDKWTGLPGIKERKAAA